MTEVITSSERQSLYNYLTTLVLDFAHSEGIFEVIQSLEQFTFYQLLDDLEKAFDYQIRDRTRERMMKVLIDLLIECDLIEEREKYFSLPEGHKSIKFEVLETDPVANCFGGQVRFFRECVSSADRFLRGENPLLTFRDDSMSIWEDFLGNREFRYARDILIKLLFSEGGGEKHLLDLCYGPGYDLLQIQQKYPNVFMTAIDFTDVFNETAMKRVIYPDMISWEKPNAWKGFGTPLPFEDNSFDIVFFSCTDPYIPSDKKEFVYRDISRILRKGGSLGIITRSYPDKKKRYVREPWIRKGVLSHDFLESVCDGWYGFDDVERSVEVFTKAGYHINAIMLNASVWKLIKG